MNPAPRAVDSASRPSFLNSFLRTFFQPLTPSLILPLIPLSLALPARTQGLDCRLAAIPPDTAGTELILQVRCDRDAGQTYAWDFGDGSSARTAAGFVRHTYLRPGHYAVTVQVGLGEEVWATVLGGADVIHRLPPGKPAAAASILFDPIRSRVWTVNPDNHTVVHMEWPSRRRSPEIRVGRRPRSLALAPDGALWVCNQEDATLTLLDGQSGAVRGTVALPRGSQPFGLVIDGRNGFAYVTAQATGSLLKISLAEKRLLGSLPVVRGARGLAMTHDGRRLFVTRFLSAADAGEVAEVDGASFAVARRLPLSLDRTGDSELGGSGVPNAVNAVVLRPDERQAWFAAKKDNTGRGLFRSGLKLDLENTVRTMVGVLDLAAGAEDLSLRRDLDNRSMAKAIAFTSRGVHAFIATEGTNSVEIYNALDMRRVGAIDPAGPANELAPQGLAVHPNDSLLFVHYFTSREIGVYDIGAAGGATLFPRLALVRTVDTDSLGESEARGQRIFYNSADVRMSRSGYLACATCHMEGGSDERVWDFTDRGEGLRNTTNLRGKGGTAAGPLHWSANFDEVQDFEHDIRDGQGGTGFLANAAFNSGTRNQPLGERKSGHSADLDALAAYVSSLRRVPDSPYRREDGTLTPAAEAGRRIFLSPETGCAKCHVPPAFTDSRLPAGTVPPAGPVEVFPGARSRYTAQGFLLHDVGTLKTSSGRRMRDTLEGLDTPPLKGVWATAPYLHDGSAADLMAVLVQGNPGDRHGRTSHLGPEEKAQLVDYLLQLDEGEAGGPSGAGRTGNSGTAPGRLAWSQRGGTVDFTWNGNRPPPALILHTFQGRRVLEIPGTGAWSPSPSGWILRWDGRNRYGTPSPRGYYLVRAPGEGAVGSMFLRPDGGRRAVPGGGK